MQRRILRCASLASALEDTPTERPMLAWFKKNPTVLSRTVSGFRCHVVAEFQFGTDYRADFVLLAPFSGGFDVHFIDLEPPNVPLFTKAGVPAARLAGAIEQINSWRLFLERNRSCVLRDLSKFVKLRDLSPLKGSEVIDNTGRPLHHPSQHLRWNYEIIIGRRGNLGDDGLEKKASFLTYHGIDLVTYDRLLDNAREMDEMSATA